MIDERKETQAGQYVPWALAASFAVLGLLLLGFGGSLRDRNSRLAERLAEAERMIAALEQEQENVQARHRQAQTNHTDQLNAFQRQLNQKTGDLRKQRTDYEARLETRGNELAQAQKQLVLLRNQAALDASELERLNELVGAALPAANSLTHLRVGVLNPTSDGPANATAAAIWDAGQQKGLLVAEGLSALPANLDYQLWVTDPSLRAPASAGTFRVNERGASRIEFKSGVQLAAPERFAISIERKGGSIAPQGRIIMATN